jgi:hypothetical protein
MTYSNQARDIIHMLFEINEFQLIKDIGVGGKANLINCVFIIIVDFTLVFYGVLDRFESDN